MASRSEHVFQAPTGTRDFYPAELNRLRYIQDAWRRTSIAHGFEEIDGPTFEHLDLYTVKSGEGIVSELFSFERFGGEKTYALRPEFTPTLARLYAARANSLPKPTKWFWTQNCFRAERPQRGRLREFYQWNVDLIGDDSPAADAEVIACCVGMLESVGLTPRDVRIHVGDRYLADYLITKAGIPDEKKAAVFRLMDELAKLTPAQLDTRARELGLDRDQIQTLEMAHHIEAPSTPLEFIESYELRERDRLKALCREVVRSGFAEWITIDFSIVRGLAYYTGMVFEVHEATGAERAIAGGGRYDGLIEMFGGPPTPAVGFGMGDVVLSLVLQDKGLLPTNDQIAERLGQRPDAYVISNGTPEADAAVGPVLAALRRGGPTLPALHARRSYKTTKNVGKLLQDAAKCRARFAVIVESETTAQLKNMDTQAQEPCPIADLAARIRAARP